MGRSGHRWFASSGGAPDDDGDGDSDAHDDSREDDEFGIASFLNETGEPPGEDDPGTEDGESVAGDEVLSLSDLLSEFDDPVTPDPDVERAVGEPGAILTDREIDEFEWGDFDDDPLGDARSDEKGLSDDGFEDDDIVEPADAMTLSADAEESTGFEDEEQHARGRSSLPPAPSAEDDLGLEGLEVDFDVDPGVDMGTDEDSLWGITDAIRARETAEGEVDDVDGLDDEEVLTDDRMLDEDALDRQERAFEDGEGDEDSDL